MATREGIYVGGYEIVERYVGDNLVWEKLKLELIGSASYPFVSGDGTSVIFNLDNANGIYNIGDLERFKQSYAVKRGGATYKVSSIELNERTGTYNEKYGYFKIFFKTVSEANKFLSKSGETSFYRKIR